MKVANSFCLNPLFDMGSEALLRKVDYFSNSYHALYYRGLHAKAALTFS